MGEPVAVSKGKGSNAARYGQAGLARHVNAYVEDIGEDGKHPDAVYAINGWRLFSTLANGSGLRTMLELESVLLAVSGQLLFRLNSAGVATLVGGIPSDGLVTMVRNRKLPNPQVAIVCDGLWFIYQGGTLTQGTDPDLPPPIAVCEIDGYFIFIIADGRWFIAGPNEGLLINPLDFAEAEASSDANVMAVVRGRTLIILGSKSAEFWDPNGNPTFPFSRTTAIDIGCFAAASVAKVLMTKKDAPSAETVIFCGTDSNGAYSGVMALSGYSAVKISTAEVDRLVRNEPNKASITGTGWTEDGHAFYCLSGSTFSKCYHNGEWHDRQSFGQQRWNASCHAQFAGMVLFGHASTNKIYESRFDLLDEDGNPIVFQIQPPPIHMAPRAFLCNQFWADFITGVGQVVGADEEVNPVVSFDYSRDGGASFAAQRQLSLGTTAQRTTRVKMRTLGRFDQNGMIPRFTCTAKVTKGLQQLWIDPVPLRG